MTRNALVSTVAGILIFCSVAGIVWFISKLGFQKIDSQAVRLTLTVTLSISLIRGWKPGRWIAIVLTFLGGIGGAVGGLMLNDASGATLILLGLSVVYIGSAIALLTPFAGRHFDNPPQAREQVQNGIE